ncbi:MAG: family transposase [Chlorobi bacterium]|nr:family transposase [Chlorobiota bacterium]
MARVDTHQGPQYTSAVFTGQLEQAGIAISMDGRGHCHDSIFIERLWRSVKYEEIYVREYLTMQKLEEELNAYFSFYNSERPHQSLGYRTPEAVYRAVVSQFEKKSHLYHCVLSSLRKRRSICQPY